MERASDPFNCRMGPESSDTEGSQEANDIPDSLRRVRRCQTAPAPSLKQAQENVKSAVATIMSDDTMERSKQGSRTATAALSQVRGAEVRRQQRSSETGGPLVKQDGLATPVLGNKAAQTPVEVSTSLANGGSSGTCDLASTRGQDRGTSVIHGSTAQNHSGRSGVCPDDSPKGMGGIAGRTGHQGQERTTCSLHHLPPAVFPCVPSLIPP